MPLTALSRTCWFNRSVHSCDMFARVRPTHCWLSVVLTILVLPPELLLHITNFLAFSRYFLLSITYKTGFSTRHIRSRVSQTPLQSTKLTNVFIDTWAQMVKYASASFIVTNDEVVKTSIFTRDFLSLISWAVPFPWAQMVLVKYIPIMILP